MCPRCPLILSDGFANVKGKETTRIWQLDRKKKRSRRRDTKSCPVPLRLSENAEPYLERAQKRGSAWFPKWPAASFSLGSSQHPSLLTPRRIENRRNVYGKTPVRYASPGVMTVQSLLFTLMVSCRKFSFVHYVSARRRRARPTFCSVLPVASRFD